MKRRLTRLIDSSASSSSSSFSSSSFDDDLRLLMFKHNNTPRHCVIRSIKFDELRSVLRWNFLVIVVVVVFVRLEFVAGLLRRFYNSSTEGKQTNQRNDGKRTKLSNSAYQDHHHSNRSSLWYISLKTTSKWAQTNYHRCDLVCVSTKW